MLGELELHGGEAFWGESVDGNAGVELQQSPDSGSVRVVVRRVIPLDMIQKGDCQGVDSDVADRQTRLLWIGAGHRPLGDAPSIVLGGFGGAEFAEIDSFSVDTDEGCASVVPHFRGHGL